MFNFALLRLPRRSLNRSSFLVARLSKSGVIFGAADGGEASDCIRAVADLVQVSFWVVGDVFLLNVRTLFDLVKRIVCLLPFSGFGIAEISLPSVLR